jgi:hypothetical protein
MTSPILTVPRRKEIKILRRAQTHIANKRITSVCAVILPELAACAIMASYKPNLSGLACSHLIFAEGGHKMRSKAAPVLGASARELARFVVASASRNRCQAVKLTRVSGHLEVTCVYHR